MLGVVRDNNFSWHTHVTKLKNESNTRLDILKVIDNTSAADKRVLINTQKSIVRSTLYHGSIVYGAANKSDSQKLDPTENERCSEINIRCTQNETRSFTITVRSSNRTLL
jgi:hypothetical protein